MNILVTGATGFIGRAFCRLAIERGHKVQALCREIDPSLPPGVEVISGSLLETPWNAVETFSPDAAVHLAWVATPGVYLTTPHNDVWLEQSKVWFSRLLKMGVPHISGAGTCIEYAASTNPLKEETSPIYPTFPYSRAKVALCEWLRDHVSGTSSDWSWFRIFYPYGPGEHPNRLCSSLIRQFKEGKSLSLRTPYSVKDYIYIDDLASALCQSLEARLSGPINLGSGRGHSVLELARLVASAAGANEDQVQIATELDLDPTPIVVASIEKLTSLGWLPLTSLESGLSNLCDHLAVATVTSQGTPQPAPR